MPRGLFVEHFGDIFEHSPQIAAAAHRVGLTGADDTAAGLHTSMVAAMRSLADDAKLALVKAHPDLAGRLAQARLLTEDSSREQASAGLDQLTASELARFTQMNDAYLARFGFPFIFAVKGRTRQDILAAFETRLRHEPDREFETALQQIEQIALLRLRDRLP